MVFPDVSFPLLSPSRIIHSAGRSLTEPPGLYHSALPRILTPEASREMFDNSRSGVFPTRSTGREGAWVLILVIMSGLLYKLKTLRPGRVSRGEMSEQHISRKAHRKPSDYGWCVEKIIYLFEYPALPLSVYLSQNFQDFFEGTTAAGEDRGIQLCIGAGLTLTQFHHQVLEFLGGLGLEGEDELVVVYPEAVGSVVLYWIVLAAYPHVLVHHALAFFEGE